MLEAEVESWGSISEVAVTASELGLVMVVVRATLPLTQLEFELETSEWSGLGELLRMDPPPLDRS